MQFKYDYLTNRLWKIKPNDPERLYEITEESQFTGNFGAQGFILANNSWITFTIYEKKIKVFAKISHQGEITYYRKEFIPIPLNQLPLCVPNFARDIMVEFSEADRVEKINGYWRKKEPS